MNRFTAIRSNIVDAIKALPGINGTPVRKLGVPEDLFHLGDRQAIGVCTTDEEWFPEQRGLADYRDNPAVMVIPIAILVNSEYPPESALEDDGKIDDLTAAILGSNQGDSGPGIRGVNVGTVETAAVYLTPIRTRIVPDANRAAGSGGALVKVLEMQTTVLPI